MEAWNNTPGPRSVPNGSYSGHGTAKAVAKFHSILACGGDLDGKHLLSPALIKEHTIARTSGREYVFGMDQMWSLGSMVVVSKDSDNGPVRHLYLLFFFRGILTRTADILGVEISSV